MGGALAGMMHERNGSAVTTLQAAQIGQQGSDLRGDILVDGMQAHERIEHEEYGLEASNGRLQRLLVLLVVQSKRRCGDDMNIERLEINTCGVSNAFEALPYDVWRILGRKQQHATGLRRWKAAQAGRTGRDRDGEIERQKRFAHFGLTTQYANPESTPQTFDQPRLFAHVRG